MTQTQRSITALYAVLPDNTAGDISPEDVRDIVETLRNGHGEMAITATAFAVSTSITSASNNQDIHLRVAKNGTSIAASDIDTFIGTGADVSAFALHAFTDVVTNDFFTLEIRNSTSSGNVTAETCNFFVMDMGIA